MKATDGNDRDPRAALTRISDVLGDPVDSFTVSDGAASDTHELLQLWLALDTAEKRQTVLAALRKLAEH